MQPRISVVTLGVSDLDASAGFYERLGFTRSRKASDEAIVFFQLHGGAVLALYPREGLAEDADLPPSEPAAFFRRHPGCQLSLPRGGGYGHGRGPPGRGRSGQAPPGRLLGRLFRLLPRPGRTPLGTGPQPLRGLRRDRRAYPAGLTAHRAPPPGIPTVPAPSAGSHPTTPGVHAPMPARPISHFSDRVLTRKIFVVFPHYSSALQVPSAGGS